MPIFDRLTVLQKKLDAMTKAHLAQVCGALGIQAVGKKADIIETIIQAQVAESRIDEIIRELYVKQAADELQGLTPDELHTELQKVDAYEWPCRQGGLDQYIQSNFTRQYVRYDELKDAVDSILATAVADYAVCSWYNTWSTWLIEDSIARHPNVVPTLRNVKGVDIFFKGQPFDLKTTVIPEQLESQFDRFVKAPGELAKWYYENQGAERFGEDNRMYIVVHDTRNPHESWKLKRNLDLIRSALQKALTEETVGETDQIVFTYAKKTYSAIGKVIFITQ